MITAYPKSELENIHLLDFAKELRDKELISEAQVEEIEKNLTLPAYLPNIFVRIGLFLITCLGIFSGLGLCWLLTGSSEKGRVIGMLFLIYGTALFFLLEYFIRKKGHFRSGIDDALTYVICLLLFLGSWIMFDPYDGRDYSFYIYGLPIFTFAAIRYHDRLMTLLSFGTVLGLMFQICLDLNFVGSWMMIPPLFILISGVVYHRIVHAPEYQEKIWFHDIRITLKYAALFVIYLSCNLFVIDYAAENLLPGGTGIFRSPVGYVFAGLTLVLPFIGFYMAYKNKDIHFVHVSLIGFLLTAATLHHYFSPDFRPESWVIKGLLGIICSYFLIKYFKKHTSQFTYLKEKENALAIVKEMGILAVGQPVQAKEEGMKFGGGDFGGGGVGGSY